MTVFRFETEQRNNILFTYDPKIPLVTRGSGSLELRLYLTTTASMLLVPIRLQGHILVAPFGEARRRRDDAASLVR